MVFELYKSIVNRPERSVIFDGKTLFRIFASDQPYDSGLAQNLFFASTSNLSHDTAPSSSYADCFVRFKNIFFKTNKAYAYGKKKTYLWI